VVPDGLAHFLSVPIGFELSLRKTILPSFLLSLICISSFPTNCYEQCAVTRLDELKMRERVLSCNSTDLVLAAGVI